MAGADDKGSSVPLTAGLRGRTAPGRLRSLDAWLARQERELLLRPSGRLDDAEARSPASLRAIAIDVGLGDEVSTTVEWADSLRAAGAAITVVGIDVDPNRVERARRAARPGLELRVASAGLPVEVGETVRVIRAMNVLRQYPEAEAREAHARWGSHLEVGGLLVEGSSDAPGQVLTAHLIRRAPEGLLREGLLFFTSFERGFAPLMFRDWLPRDLRRRAVPGHPVRAFLDAWTSAWEQVREERGAATSREAFALSCTALRQREPAVLCDDWMQAAGYLCWKPRGGIPAG